MRGSPVRDAALKNGWRSGLEEQVGNQLGDTAEYEPFRLRYTRPAEPAHYTPDFVLPNGIIIETKGRFVTADRKKHKLIKAQEPDLDIRFVFTYPNAKIGKKSKTSYADWCKQFGFRFAQKFVPESWRAEPTNHKSLAAIERMRAKK